MPTRRKPSSSSGTGPFDARMGFKFPVSPSEWTPEMLDYNERSRMSAWPGYSRAIVAEWERPKLEDAIQRRRSLVDEYFASVPASARFNLNRYRSHVENWIQTGQNMPNFLSRFEHEMRVSQTKNRGLGIMLTDEGSSYKDDPASFKAEIEEAFGSYPPRRPRKK